MSHCPFVCLVCLRLPISHVDSQRSGHVRRGLQLSVQTPAKSQQKAHNFMTDLMWLVIQDPTIRYNAPPETPKISTTTSLGDLSCYQVFGNACLAFCKKSCWLTGPEVEVQFDILVSPFLPMQSCAGRKPDRNLLENFSFGKLVRHYTLLQSFPKKHSCLAIIAMFSHFSHGSWERMSRMSWMSRMSRMSRIRHEMVPQWAMLAQMLHFRRWLFGPRDLRMRNDNDQVSQYPGRSPAQSLEAPEFLVNCHWQTVFLMFFLIFHSVRVFINILPEPGWLMLASLFQEKMNPCQLYCAAGRRQAHVTKVANAALPVSMHNLCTLSQDWTPLNQVEQAAEGSKGRQSNHVILHCYLKNFSEDSKAFKGILLGVTIPLLVFLQLL